MHRSLPPEGTAFALPEMTNAELTTAGAFTNGSQSLGGSAPAISSASTASVAESESSVKQKYSFGGESYSIVNTRDMPWEEQVGISAMMGQSRGAIHCILAKAAWME